MTQIELVQVNLCLNGRDANVLSAKRPPGLPPGDYVSVGVADSGRGMGEEVLAKALDPFFTTKDIGKGSGLGLSRCKEQR
jgi:two-component system cell cycle sensor histidine kinase/response regulator CckA